MSDADLEAYIRERLDGHRELLRNTNGFFCASCGKPKTANEAAGVHHYKTDDPALRKAMIDPKSGRPRIGTYAICLECIDSFPEETIHQNVTMSMAKDGLFGGTEGTR